MASERTSGPPMPAFGNHAADSPLISFEDGTQPPAAQNGSQTLAINGTSGHHGIQLQPAPAAFDSSKIASISLATGYPPNDTAPLPPEQQQMVSAQRRPTIRPGLQATCPMICAVQNLSQESMPDGSLPPAGPQYVPLKIEHMSVSLECHIATGFVTVAFTTYLPKGAPVDPQQPATFFLPKHVDATVTSVAIEHQERDSVYATMIIPTDEAQKFAKKAAKGRPVQAVKTDDYDPELFTMALADVCPGDRLLVTVSWFQPLQFVAGQYQTVVPMEIPADAMEAFAASPAAFVDVRSAINTGTGDEVRWYCPSHPTRVLSQTGGRVELAANADKPWANVDFQVGYQVWHGSIVASVNTQAGDPTSYDPRSTFAVTVSPPAPSSTQAFSRSVVLVVDRSGSMAGEPEQYARDAINVALSQLSPDDEVNIIAYDHEQTHWSGTMVRADAAMKVAAAAWVEQHVQARGLTDIKTPLIQALDMLRTARGVPYVFLVTDGAVDNEKDICRHMEAFSAQPRAEGQLLPRVSTFAIGPFCNHYFLKQLAVQGKGLFDVAFRPTNIASQMERMLTAAAKPVLTEVTVGIEGLVDCELYPFPIPDLFCGMPLLVAGKYEGDFPKTITLNGRLPDGSQWSQTVHATQAASIPLDKVFVKQRLDLLTARAWLEGDNRIKTQVVRASIAAGVPCAHTVMVGFPTTKAQYVEMKVAANQKRRISPAKLAVGGAAAVVVLGGATALFAFGDVGSTLSNIGIGDGGGGLFGGGGDGGCCDCGAFCGDIGDCCGDVGDCCGTMCDAFGACLSAMA